MGRSSDRFGRASYTSGPPLRPRGGESAGHVLELPRMRTAIRAVTAVGAFLVLQELVLRAVFPLPEVLNFDRASYSHIGSVRDPSAPATLGHASVRWVSEPDGFDFVHALNLYGFRDREWRLRKPDGATRVAFFGDSFVEGFSAPAEATLPAAFAALADWTY